MKLFKYKDYNEYVEKQNAAFQLKHSRNWVTEMELAIIANKFVSTWDVPKFVICHGARNGFEVHWLQTFFGRTSQVIGTDIGEWSEHIEGMYRWDFHDMNEEWRNKADLIYSNSLDHACDPDLAIKTWVQCLSPHGVLAVQWAGSHGKGEPKGVDCFIAGFNEYMDLIGKYAEIQVVFPIRILKCGNIIFAQRKDT